MPAKLPVDVVKARGRSHKSKEEIERREQEEVRVPFDEAEPPEYLTKKKEKEQFEHYASMLKACGIFTDLDVDCLGRYVLAQNMYVTLTKKLTRQIAKMGTDEFDVRDFDKSMVWQDKAFKQATECAKQMGMTITSRCRIVVPQVDNAEDYEL